MSDALQIRDIPRGIRLNLVADASGDINQPLGRSIAGAFTRYEAWVGGGAVWTFKLLGDGAHDMLEGTFAALAHSTALSGTLTQAIGAAGALGHVPLLLLLDATALCEFSGGADATGHVELLY